MHEHQCTMQFDIHLNFGKKGDLHPSSALLQGIVSTIQVWQKTKLLDTYLYADPYYAPCLHLCLLDS